MTEQEKLLNEITSISHRIDKDEKLIVTILGKDYKLRDTKRWVLDKIIEVLYDVNYTKSNSKTLKSGLRRIQNCDVKIASYIILNAWSYIPFLHAIHWRYMKLTKTSEVFSGIIEAGIDNPENAFFLKSSLILRKLLVSRTQMIQVQE